MGSTGIPSSSNAIMQPRLYRKPAGVHHYSRKKKRLRRLMAWIVSLFTIFFLFFMGFLYSSLQPFEMLRSLWVTSAMTTMNHQYLATWFFNDAEIKRIQQSNDAAILGNSNPSSINMLRSGSNNGTELIDVSQKGFKGYLLKVNNPARVKVAATHYLGKKGEKAEDIAKETGAVAVINGGMFDDPQGNGNGGHPLGILISGGSTLYKEPVTTYDIIGLNRSNVLVLGHYTQAQIKQLGIRDAVTFSPFLVVNGKPAITHGDGGWGIAPRTAIGQAQDGTILMLVIDGRQIGSIGATLKDVQDIMLKYGAYNVANLDGGASTVLYYDNQIVNHPSSQYGERLAPSFFIVK
ncbi:phosphodiester glycosidase family protein [Desulfosporosinus sp. Sb-LF]|uniref:phosphodiester glycosidase family protein n=1 Tax=Desulfosporosinus sp. Sb-LF TaxID=2560027 RepID=UPI00107F0619|nr:phosphodiester glycosidase family protein [Desulfosporosinus sp. Sb-LF]TGE32229.1 phosphodiester glycosidase family protein [Desulfosporosinus sp. Sb-LF]